MKQLRFHIADGNYRSVEFGEFSENLGYKEYDEIIKILTANGWNDVTDIILFDDGEPVRKWSPTVPVKAEELVGQKWQLTTFLA